ncbi:MAG TPA: PAS domain-containing protein, partial [Fusibacter sp.]|nr:PAS domain-containing protein [Fusibacter sp.]
EYRFFKNGGWQWFRATGKYIDADDGASIVIINQNISEIKTITQKLMESRVILTESERIANMAHWKFLVSKNLFAVSQTVGSVFQHKENVEEIYFESLLESIYPVDLDFFKLKFEKFIWNNENLDIIFRLHNRGKITYVNMIGQVYYDDENLPIYAIGSVADVTERMLVKQRFEESRTLLEHVVEQIPMGIIVIRSNGIIEKINSQAVQLLKIDAVQIERTEDLILHIMMKGDNLDLVELETLFNPTISTKMEQTFAMKDQTHLRLSSSHMKDADQHFLGRIINITLVETQE